LTFLQHWKDPNRKLNIKTNTFFDDYLKNRVAESIYLTAPHVREIVSLINGLNIKKATGYDDIPAYFYELLVKLLPPFYVT